MAQSATPTGSQTGTDVQERLDRIVSRISEIRAANTSGDGSLERQLCSFDDLHSGIRERITTTADQPTLAQAHADSVDLEKSIERWFQSIDNQFENPPPRVKSVSM